MRGVPQSRAQIERSEQACSGGMVGRVEGIEVALVARRWGWLMLRRRRRHGGARFARVHPRTQARGEVSRLARCSAVRARYRPPASAEREGGAAEAPGGSRR